MPSWFLLLIFDICGGGFNNVGKCEVALRDIGHGLGSLRGWGIRAASTRLLVKLEWWGGAPRYIQ